MIAVAAALAGCGGGLKQGDPVEAAPASAGLTNDLSIGCYTVDLFDPYRINYPGADVPVQYAKFLGVWKDGSWNNEWCHDLYVTDVQPDGTVTVLDAYGPYPKLNVEAQVYKRTGRIDEEGVLNLISLGGANVTYRLVDDAYLVGRRLSLWGKYDITMARHEGVAIVPIPPRNPRRG